MAKLESFASLDITGFQRSLKKLGDEVNAFERQLQKKKFEIDLSVNTKALDNLGKIGFDRIANNFKQLESAMRRISDIKLSFTPFEKLAAVSKGLGETTNQLSGLSKTLSELKNNNFTFNTKAFQDLSKVNLDAITKQIAIFMNSMKSLGSANFSVNISELQKLSTLNLGNITGQLSSFATSVKSLNGVKLNIGLTGIQALSSLNIQNVLTQIPQLAKALKSLEGINVNLNLRSLNDIAKLDVSRVTQALNQLIPTLQKLNNINVNIQLPTTGVNQISQLGQSFGLYSNYARSFAGAIGLISPQMSSMFYWTGRVAESMGLYNTATTLGKFNTIALVTSIGALIGVLIALGATAVEQGQKFENAFAILKANGVETLKAVKTSLEAIRDTDISTARRGLADYAEALANLTRAGQTGAEGLEILKQASFLASAEGTNLSDTAIELTRNLLQFQMTAKDAARAVDSLTLASNDAVGTQSDLSKGLNTVGAIAKQAGFSFEETLAALVQLDNKGLSAADKGATALRNVLAAATSPTVAFRNAAKQLGVDLVDSAGKTRQGRDIIFDLVHVLSNARVTYDELTGEIRGNADAVAAASTLFRTRGFAAILSLSDGVEGLANKYRDGKGAAQDYAETLSKTFTGSLDQLKSAAKDAGTNLFQLVGPTLVAGLKAATGVVGGFRDVLNTLSSTPAFTQSLLALGAAALFISNASKLAAVGVATYNTVTALAIPLGQAGIVTLAGTNIAFARLSVSAKLAAVSVGLFQKASSLLVLNPVIATATAAFIALGGAIAFATKNYEDMAAASEKQIEKNTQFLESLKKARAEGNRVSPELGNLRAREVVQLDRVKTLGQAPDTSVKEMQDAIARLNKTRAEIQAELKKYAVDTASTFSVSEETQKSIDALNERAQSTALRFKDIKDQGLDKTFLDISASIRELIKGLDDIPEISGNAKAYQAYVDKFTALENNLKAAAIDKAVIDAKSKNADDFAAIEKEKTSILKDQAQKRKLELEQELKDLETKYNKQIELARKNLQQAQQSKNANPSQVADLSAAVSQAEKNKESARRVAIEREKSDQKEIAQTKIDKEIEVNNKILTLRQQAAQQNVGLLKIQSDALNRQYQTELDMAGDNLKAKIEIDNKYREAILANAKKQLLAQLNIDRQTAQQRRDQAIRDAQKVEDLKARNQLVNLAKSNYASEVGNLQAQTSESFKASQIQIDKQVADHRRALAETYYKAKLDQDRAIYENQTRYLDDLSAKELYNLKAYYLTVARQQKASGNTRSSELATDFAKKVKDQELQNQSALSKKIPDIKKQYADLSADLKKEINLQDAVVSKVTSTAGDRFIGIAEKAKSQVDDLNKAIAKVGKPSQEQISLLKQLKSLIDLANAKASQANTGADLEFKRGLNDNAANRQLEKASRDYSQNLDAEAYKRALLAYEAYWASRLEVAKKYKDPVERASKIVVAEDNVFKAQSEIKNLQEQSNTLRERAAKLELDVLQAKILQSSDEKQKIIYADAIINKLKEQINLAKDAVNNSKNSSERIDNTEKVLNLEKELSNAYQTRNQIQQDSINKQKTDLETMISLRESELNIQSKSAQSDADLITAFDNRVAAIKSAVAEEQKLYEDLARSKKDAENRLASLPAGDPGRNSLESSIEASKSQLQQLQIGINNNIARSLDAQQQKEDFIVGSIRDQLQTKEAIQKAQDNILGKSNDAVAAAKSELDLAKQNLKAVEETIKARGLSGKSDADLMATTQGRQALKDRADAVSKEASARKNLSDAERSTAEAQIDRDTKRKKLALEIADIGDTSVENARIDVQAQEAKLGILLQLKTAAANLVEFDKASRDYADAELQLQADKLKLKKLEADVKYKNAVAESERTLKIAQAQLELSEQAGNRVAELNLQIEASTKILTSLKDRRAQLNPGSTEFKDNEVLIVQQQAKVLDLIRDKNKSIAGQKRVNVDLTKTQAELELRLSGLGRGSAEIISKEIDAAQQRVSILRQQLNTTDSLISRNEILKDIYNEQLGILDLQDQKTKSIFETRQAEIDKASSAKQLELAQTNQASPSNLTSVELDANKQIVTALREKLAATADVEEKARIQTELNKALIKQDELSSNLGKQKLEEKQKALELTAANNDLKRQEAKIDSDGVDAISSRIEKKNKELDILKQSLEFANSDQEKTDIEIAIATKKNEILKDNRDLLQANANIAKQDIDLQKSAINLSDVRSVAFESRIIKAQQSLRDAEADLQKLMIDQSVIEKTGSTKEKKDAQIGINNQLAKVELERKNLIKAQNDELISQYDQQNKIAGLEAELNALRSGQLIDELALAKDKIALEQDSLAILRQNYELAEGSDAKNAARMAVLQKEIEIQKDIDAVKQASYDREKSMLELSRSQVDLISKQLQLSSKKLNLDGDNVVQSQIDKYTAGLNKSEILKQIDLASSKPVKTISEQIEKNKELNALQGEYLDAQGQEIEAEKKYQKALRERESIYLRLKDSSLRLQNTLSFDPSDPVKNARTQLDYAKGKTDQSVQEAMKAIGEIGNGADSIDNQMTSASDKIDQVTSSIDAQRQAIEGLISAYEQQIQAAINLTSASLKAAEVVDAGMSKNSFQKQGIDDYKRQYELSKSLSDKLLSRLDTVLASGNSSYEDITNALNQFTNAEQQRQQYLEKLNKVDKSGAFTRGGIFSASDEARRRELVNKALEKSGQAQSKINNASNQIELLKSQERLIGALTNLTDALKNGLNVAGSRVENPQIDYAKALYDAQKESLSGPVINSRSTELLQSEASTIIKSVVDKLVLDIKSGIDGAKDELKNFSSVISEDAKSGSRYAQDELKKIIDSIKTNLSNQQPSQQQSAPNTNTDTQSKAGEQSNTELSGLVKDAADALSQVPTGLKSIELTLGQTAEAIKGVAVPQPLDVQVPPSTAENATRLGPVDSAPKNNNYSFGDINQTINTQGLKEEDIPRLIRAMKNEQKKQYENFGGNC